MAWSSMLAVAYFLSISPPACAGKDGQLRGTSPPTAPQEDGSSQENYAAVGMASVANDWCADTNDWTNGYSDCWNKEHKRYTDGCTPSGWTCAGYVKQGWCKDGQRKAGSWAFGHGLKYPEQNCCACGKGSSNSYVASARAGGDGTSPGNPTALQENSSSHENSTALQPNESIVVGMASVANDWCADTNDWTNGYSDCWNKQHKRYTDGCTPSGWTCAGYVKQGWCKDGQRKAGSWAFGHGLKYPEQNCCACGKGSSNSYVASAHAGEDGTSLGNPTAPQEDGSSHENSTALQPNESIVVGMASVANDWCADTNDWTNGWSDCWNKQHKRYTDGCTPSGWTCAGYVKQGWCKDGRRLAGSWAFGRSLKNPEDNCCACGRH